MAVGKITTLGELVQVRHDLDAAGKKLVFTNGCFDLLHLGHIRYLRQARALGDALAVAVNSDRSVRENKGPTRPIVPEDERAEVLAALEFVDYVLVFDEPTPREVVAAVVPHVLVKGSDWGANIVGRDTVEAAGGKVLNIPLVEGTSTSAIIARIVERFADTPPARA